MSLFITSTKDRFRRCGVFHSKQGQAFADDHFTEAQLAQLKADPMLVVEVRADEAPTTAGAQTTPPIKASTEPDAQAKPQAAAKPADKPKRTPSKSTK